MTSRRRIRSIVTRAALASLLLCLQVTAASHLDVDGHSQEAQCAICISVSTLDGSNVSDHDFIISRSPWQAPELFHPVLVAATIGELHLARAPPAVS